MSEIIEVIAKLSAFAFVITSMLAMGLSLTVEQIIDPFRNTPVVSLALVAAPINRHVIIDQTWEIPGLVEVN